MLIDCPWLKGLRPYSVSLITSSFGFCEDHVVATVWHLFNLSIMASFSSSKFRPVSLTTLAGYVNGPQSLLVLGQPPISVSSKMLNKLMSNNSQSYFKVLKFGMLS